MKAPNTPLILKMPFKNPCPCLLKSTFASIRVKRNNHYISQSELPPHCSLSPLPVPALNSPSSSLLAQLSSPALSDVSSSLTAVDPKYGLDEDAVANNQFFVMRIGNNRPVISAPTHLLNVPITCHPASADCPQYICPHCHLSAPGHPQTACLSTQCNFCSQWGHIDRFCPARTCNLQWLKKMSQCLHVFH